MTFLRQDCCLICHNPISPEIGWRVIFSVQQEQLICRECESKLEKITGKTCQICGRPFQLVAEDFRHGDICHDCYRWEEDSRWQGVLKRNQSLFVYNDFLKEVLAKFKFRGDYDLVRVFAPYVKQAVQKINADLFVPIPLSSERLYERGFNQAAALLVGAGLPVTELLTRIHLEKQSKKSRTERIHLPQVFNVIQNADIQGRSIVLIDDIYTTGSTIRHGARLLQQAGAASIQSLTLAR
ncbi:ComF family protein [Bacillus rubiinfantis]|uniref:ComF family protein n=1 Tax=Bacillus rubiinfantis TaxID=1499680 RepID=UPI0005A7904D|nr:ComF family protein [Bacillus rubiinfantis]